MGGRNGGAKTREEEEVILESDSHCLKIIEKVSSNIASEASYTYIFSGPKFIKNAKNCQFWRVFEMRHFE